MHHMGPVTKTTVVHASRIYTFVLEQFSECFAHYFASDSQKWSSVSNNNKHDNPVGRRRLCFMDKRSRFRGVKMREGHVLFESLALASLHRVIHENLLRLAEFPDGTKYYKIDEETF